MEFIWVHQSFKENYKWDLTQIVDKVKTFQDIFFSPSGIGGYGFDRRRLLRHMEKSIKKSQEFDIFLSKTFAQINLAACLLFPILAPCLNPKEIM